MALTYDFGLGNTSPGKAPLGRCGERIGGHRADTIVERRVIVEVKATQVLPDFSKRQLLNYLRAFDLQLGILLHFGPKPSFHRVLSARKPEK